MKVIIYRKHPRQKSGFEEKTSILSEFNGLTLAVNFSLMLENKILEEPSILRNSLQVTFHSLHYN